MRMLYWLVEVSSPCLLIWCWYCEHSCLNCCLTLQICCQTPQPCCWTRYKSPHQWSLHFFHHLSCCLCLCLLHSVLLSSSLSDSESACDGFWGGSEESLEEEIDWERLLWCSLVVLLDGLRSGGWTFWSAGHH